jgi:hypothetical protein
MCLAGADWTGSRSALLSAIADYGAIKVSLSLNLDDTLPSLLPLIMRISTLIELKLSPPEPIAQLLMSAMRRDDFGAALHPDTHPLRTTR